MFWQFFFTDCPLNKKPLWRKAAFPKITAFPRNQFKVVALEARITDFRAGPGARYHVYRTQIPDRYLGNTNRSIRLRVNIVQ